MAIDRIGKGSAPPAPKPATETEKSRGTEGPRAFEVRTPGQGGAEAVAPASPAGTGALERLRRGEVDLEGDLDLKVSEATAHLRGLRPAELEGIRAALRDQLTRDPALAALVKQATGEAPSPRE